MALEQLKGQLERRLRIALLLLRLQTLSLTVIYLVFLLSVGFGNRIVNIVLLALSILYGVFLIIITFVPVKGAKRIGSRTYRYLRLAVNAVGLGMNIYGLVISASNVTFFSIFLITLSFASFLAKLVVEIILIAVSRRLRHAKERFLGGNPFIEQKEQD